MPKTLNTIINFTNHYKQAIVVIVFILIFTACKKTVSNIAELNEWLNTPTNGCIKSTSISGIKITAKYLPPTYSVLRDLNRNKVINIDSIMLRYDSTIMFLFTIGVDKDSKGKVQSVMDANVEDYSSYTDRVLATNFGMEKYLRLYINNTEYYPIYAIVENVYEVSDTRNFIVLFRNSTENSTDNEWVFTYNDEFFNIGEVQIAFNPKDISRANKITINKT